MNTSYAAGSHSWYVIANNGAGSTTGPTWSFTRQAESDPVSPVLSNTQNLNDCITIPSKKCVKINDTAELKFLITDFDNNLSSFDVNWDGVGSPEFSQNISGGDANITVSHIFDITDIQNCSGDQSYKIDGNCWKKDITVTATAYDSTSKASNTFSQNFILYDPVSYQAAIDEKQASELELDAQTTTLQDQKADETILNSNLSNLENSCTEIKEATWRDNTVLNTYDPFRKKDDGSFDYCRKDKHTLHKCSEVDEQCSDKLQFSSLPALSFVDASGLDYSIKTTYDHLNDTKGGCANYPARVDSTYTIDGAVTDYETEYVYNFDQKSTYLKDLNYRLKLELIAKGDGRFVGKCNIGDYTEWTIEEWKTKIQQHSGYDSAVNQYSNATGLSYEEAAKGVVDGTAKALHEIVNEYKELPGTVSDVIGGALSLVGSFITKPLETANQVSDKAEEIGAIAKQIAAEIIEVIPDLPAAISHLKPYEKAFFTAYITTLVAHELAPTAKLKLLKLDKFKVPKWLVEAVFYVRIYKLDVRIPKANFDQLDVDSKRFVNNEFKLKENPYSEREFEHAKALANKNTNIPWYKKNWERGNKFNKEQWDSTIKNELYLCKSPNGCNDNPPKYVRLDAYNDLTNPPQIISRKHTQFSEIKTETAKGYIDELVTKYKPGMVGANVKSNTAGTNLNKTNIGMANQAITGDQVLQVPTQKKGGIPKEIMDYAELHGVDIVEVPSSVSYP